MPRSSSAGRAAAQRDREARRRRRGWLALLLVLLLTTVALLAGWYLVEGRFTSAPGLTGVTGVEAESPPVRVDLAIPV